MQVSEHRRNGADVAGWFGSPDGRVKMFDQHLVHAIIGGKNLCCGSAELSVNLVLTRGHGSLLLELSYPSDRTLGHHIGKDEVMPPHFAKSVLAQMSRELSPMLHTVKQGLTEHFPLACLDTRETYFLHFIPIFRLC